MAALNDLLAALEGSLTSKDFDADSLCRHLRVAETFLNTRPSLEPAEMQKAVSVLCSWLRSHEDGPAVQAHCLRAVLQTTSSLLGQDQATDNIAIQKGLLSSVTALLSSRAADIALVRTGLEVLATLSVVEGTDQIINRLGAIVVIVDLLQRHGAEIPLLEDAITTLAIMAKRTRHRKAMENCRGVLELVDLLKRHVGTQSLVVAVCRFLSNFAVKEECCITVLTNGGIDALVSAFTMPVSQLGAQGGLTAADTRATVASAIWVCSMDCQQVQTTLLSSGFLSSLSSVLAAHRGHVGLLEASLGIVRGLCRHKKYTQEILSLGFVKVAAQAMEQFPDSIVIQKEASGIFGNLATDAAIREQLGESGVLQEVVKALARCRGSDDRKVAKLALGALMNLSSSDANREILANTEVVPTILRVAHTFMQNENILEYAIWVISHISVHSVSGRALVEAGAVEALLLFLKESQDLMVISRSLVALRRLVKTTAAVGNEALELALVQQIVRAGCREGVQGIQLLVAAMQAHVYDETVCKETSLLFVSLARVQTSIAPLMTYAAQPCMKALEVHQNDPSTSDSIAALLALLPLEDDAEWSKGPDSSPKTSAEVLSSFGVAAQVPGAAKARVTSGGYAA